MKIAYLEKRDLTITFDERGTGQPVILLHAFPFDSEMWKPQLAGLAYSCRVIAPDFPWFVRYGEQSQVFTVDEAADLLADFLDAIGIHQPVVLGGLSMGGYVALAFARRHPQRLRGLILADTKAAADDEQAKANRDDMIELARQRGSAEVIEKLLPKLVSEKTQIDAPDVVETVRRMASRQPVPTVVAALQALRERPDAKANLNKIHVPTLVVVGEEDVITPPKEAQEIVQQVPNARLVVVPGVGHLSNLEAPSFFNHVVQTFLTTIA